MAAAVGHPDRLLCVFRLELTWPRPLQPGVGHFNIVSCIARTARTQRHAAWLQTRLGTYTRYAHTSQRDTAHTHAAGGVVRRADLYALSIIISALPPPHRVFFESDEDRKREIELGLGTIDDWATEKSK